MPATWIGKKGMGLSGEWSVSRRLARGVCDCDCQSVRSVRSVSPQLTFSTKQAYVVDDNMIKAMLANRPFDRGTGKRLRHEKNKKVKVDTGGPSIWQMLHCYPIAETPQPKPPDLKVNKDDPFNFYID
ncbi:WD repeat-containing protein on y chromosome-like [Plakobranchus ocellatus]|uniref:WD repeat-containing protein on y chromosome-like n=1 Tax=Plakobranchus ocellatus TaxID=259542 RepID=A0AAV4BGD8_9GAST|nr:WD repeat-containing protein on y chromosome-like [Plakobranchus ocellatus]